MNSSEREIALRRAEAFGRVLFGLSAPEETLLPVYGRSIPREFLPTAVALADALIELGIETPEDLARFLGSGYPQETRSYSQALWNAVTIVAVAKSGQPDWDAIYLLVDGENAEENAEESEEDDESEEEFAAREVAEAKQWADKLCKELVSFHSLLLVAGSRPGLGLDERGAVKAMEEKIAAIQDGKICEGTWTLRLTLSQGMDDGSSRGTRTLELSVGEGVVNAQCFGTEWQRGIGSDSWTGANFCFSKSQANEREGDFYNFVDEFKDAIRDQNYFASVSLDDESIGCLPKAEPKDGLGDLLAKAVIRRLVEELQSMEETLSGDDSILENVWDEICTQKQIEESFCWEAYETTVRTLIAGAVEDLLPEERVKLWLLTEPGEDWEADKESPNETPAPCDADVANFLFDRLMSLASDYLNQRIIRYRDRPTD